jgi:RNase P subunit RPR2
MDTRKYIRWKCPTCGYLLDRNDIRSNVEEGSFDSPSTLVIACPGCIEAIRYRALKTVIMYKEGGKKCSKSRRLHSTC